MTLSKTNSSILEITPISPGTSSRTSGFPYPEGNHRVRNLDSFLVVAYEEQIITAHCALMNSEYADFADVRVVNNFEYMSNQWKFRIRN